MLEPTLDTTFRLPRLHEDKIFLSALATLLVFVIVDRLVLRFARISSDTFSNDSLLLSSLRSHWLLYILGVLLVAALGRMRLLSITWGDVGSHFRMLAFVLIVVLTWRRVTLPFDYLHDQWHTADRLLLIVFAIAAMWRPVALLPFVLTVRVLAAPTVATIFGPGNNIDELAVLLLIAIAAGTLLASRLREYRTQAILVISLAAIGAQFFIPGWSKLRSGWPWHNDLQNLPLNGHAQGWLGAGSGEFSSQASDFIDIFSPVLIAGTLLIELGAIVFVTRHGLSRLWLGALILFHLANLLMIGFVFFEFIVVEAAMIALLSAPTLRNWAAEAFTGAAPLIGAAAVLFGSTIFHPPTLAWYDANLVYRYDIDGFDEDGGTWQLESADFAPYAGAFAFGSLDLGPTQPLASGYGSASRVQFEQVRDVRTFDELEELERASFATCNPETRQETVAVLTSFLSESPRSTPGFLIPPPDQFVTSRDGEDYDISTTLLALEVDRITILRENGNELERSEPVLRLERTTKRGPVEVTWLHDSTC